jgi:hypothetical protein
MSRVVGKGAIVFGLVYIPVELRLRRCAARSYRKHGVASRGGKSQNLASHEIVACCRDIRRRIRSSEKVDPVRLPVRSGNPVTAHFNAWTSMLSAMGNGAIEKRGMSALLQAPHAAAFIEGCATNGTLTRPIPVTAPPSRAVVGDRAHKSSPIVS